MNLKVPDIELREQGKAWLSLTANLFPFVQAALGKHEPFYFNALRRDLETWELFVEHDAKRRSQWNLARRLLWCAENADKLTTPTLNDVEFALSAMMENTPDFIKEDEDWVGWVWDCSRILRGAHTQETSITIALSNDTDKLDDNGTLAKLVLEVLEPGMGQIFQHPEDSIKALTSEDFKRSMQDAWIAAKKLAESEDRSFRCNCNGHWRLLLQNERPVSGVNGRSASGAAALGWYHKLKGTVYDQGVIVLAQVNKDGILEGVGGVTAKVKAIAENTALDWHIDTIVVASKDNEIEANTALKSLHMDGVIKVVNLDANNT